MREAQSAPSDDEGPKPCAPEARQCIFGRRVVLASPRFHGLVGCTVFQDKPGMGNGTMKEEVPRGKSHGGEMFFKELAVIFFRPPSPPKEGGEQREK
jgi:hypothetical protein